MATIEDVGGTGQPHQSDARRAHEHSLERNALGFWDAIVMAVAGSAPAYSIAATTALIVGAVGIGAPAALLWCGIPMMGIAVAYHHLNKLGASAGAAYEWVGRVLHPILGFFTGWGLVISATIFMVAGSIPAGEVTVSLFTSSAASHTVILLVGAVWFLTMAYFVARGVRITANAQWIMSSIEVVLLVIFGLLGLFHHHRVSFSMSWLGFGHFGSFSGFVAGALIAAFYYWGWDVSSNLGEETEESRKNSGIGGIIGVLIVFALFELFTICINMTMTPGAIQSNSSNVLEAYGRVIGGGFGSKLMIVAVALSTIATLETTLIQVTRSLFAMAREKTLPKQFGVLHPTWNTPVFATVVVAVVSLLFFGLSEKLGSVNTVLNDAISSIGLQIAIYYALAGFAAVVAFRKLLLKSISNFLMMGLFPLLGAAFMTFIFVKSIPGLSAVVLWIGLGGMAFGFIPIIYYYAKGSAYLHQRPTLGSIPPEEEFAGADIARID